MGRREDIAAKIAERVIVCPDTGCHIWTGPTSGDTGRGKGYPRMNLDGQTVAVHRVVYTNEHGYIPGRKQIDHDCNNRLCVNIKHLFMTTHKKNQKLRAKRAKKAKTVQLIAQSKSLLVDP